MTTICWPYPTPIKVHKMQSTTDVSKIKNLLSPVLLKNKHDQRTAYTCSDKKSRHLQNLSEKNSFITLNLITLFKK